MHENARLRDCFPPSAVVDSSDPSLACLETLHLSVQELKLGNVEHPVILEIARAQLGYEAGCRYSLNLGFLIWNTYALWPTLFDVRKIFPVVTVKTYQGPIHTWQACRLQNVCLPAIVSYVTQNRGDKKSESHLYNIISHPNDFNMASYYTVVRAPPLCDLCPTRVQVLQCLGEERANRSNRQLIYDVFLFK